MSEFKLPPMDDDEVDAMALPPMDDEPPAAEPEKGYGLKDLGKDVIDAVPFLPNDMDFGGALDAFSSSMSNIPLVSPAIRNTGKSMVAGSQALKDRVLGKEKDLGAAFGKRLNEYDDREESQEKIDAGKRKNHPTAALMGSVAQMGVMPATAVKAGATLGSKVLAGGVNTGITASAAYADAIGRGASNEEAMTAAKSAAAFSGILSSLPPAVHAAKTVGAGAKQFARNRAIKSLDPILSQQELLNNKGITDKLADELLDSGVVKFGSSVDGMLPRVEKVLGDKGRRIGAIRDEADKVINANQSEKIDLGRLLKKADIQQGLASDSNLPAQRAARAYTKNAEAFNNTPRRNIEQVQQEIESLNQQIPFKQAYAERSPDKQILTDLRADLQEGVSDKISSLLPERAAEYKQNMSSFPLFKGAEEILSKSSARQARNGDFGFRDLMAAGIPKGGDAAGSLTAIASKLARERGNSSLAASSNMVAKVLGSDPSKLGPFASILQKASERGPLGVLTAHKILMKEDEQYRSMVGTLPEMGDE